MTKRNLATVLWFFAGYSGGGLVFGFLGMPLALALVPGIAVAALVRWDPMGLFWPVTDERRVRPINEFADDLEKNAPAPAAGDADRTSL
jgi:hypothetical protein